MPLGVKAEKILHASAQIADIEAAEAIPVRRGLIDAAQGEAGLAEAVLDVGQFQARGIVADLEAIETGGQLDGLHAVDAVELLDQLRSRLPGEGGGELIMLTSTWS
ncbi:MAG: hypothetical protein QM757_43895 [Paludibaculum sp.]